MPLHFNVIWPCVFTGVSEKEREKERGKDREEKRERREREVRPGGERERGGGERDRERGDGGRERGGGSISTENVYPQHTHIHTRTHT